MNKRVTAALAATSIICLALTGCGKKGESQSSDGTSAGGTAATSDYQACMVTDTGGIDDNGFNGASWAGLEAAQTSGKVKASYVQSKSEADYATNISSLKSQGCKLIMTVGGLMADATTAAATAAPDLKFIQIDAPGNGGNIRGIQYNTAQASFLAGYLAAGYSQTGVVATWGGLKIPPVTVFMDGFAEGITYFNEQNGKDVQLLGWDEAAQNGSFAGSFSDQSKGQQLATNFIAQGADVIFPVAGDAGLGTAAAAQTSGKAAVIWVNKDGYDTETQYKDVFLTTVEKNIAGPVQEMVEATAAGTTDTSDYLGTLKNDGVGLSDFHDFDSKISADVKTALEEISTKIQSGEIVIKSAAQPAVK